MVATRNFPQDEKQNSSEDNIYVTGFLLERLFGTKSDVNH